MDTIPDNSILLLSDARGIYIPRDFVREVSEECITGMSAWARETLESGPDAEGYWDAWNDVLDNVRVTDHKNGITYYIWQDGDCWLIPVDGG